MILLFETDKNKIETNIFLEAGNHPLISVNAEQI